MASSFGQYRFASDSLTTMVGSASRSWKSRPRLSGIPSVEK
jgi:hypothetical protein